MPLLPRRLALGVQGISPAHLRRRVVYRERVHLPVARTHAIQDAAAVLCFLFAVFLWAVERTEAEVLQGYRLRRWESTAENANQWG